MCITFIEGKIEVTDQNLTFYDVWAAIMHKTLFPHFCDVADVNVSIVHSKSVPEYDQ